MRIGILGSGDVAQALAFGFLERGDEVKLGTRDPSAGMLDGWVNDSAERFGGRASVGTFAEVAEFGEWVVLATKGAHNAAVLEDAGPERLAGKPLIDVTNPLDDSRGMPPALIVPPEGSGAEQVQALVPKAHVVKCWNSVGNPLMIRPDLPGGPPTMFICGDHDGTKATLARWLTDFGWEVSDVGALGMAHHLESLCIIWVAHGMASGSWSHAFKVLKA